MTTATKLQADQTAEVRLVMAKFGLSEEEARRVTLRATADIEALEQAMVVEREYFTDDIVG